MKLTSLLVKFLLIPLLLGGAIFAVVGCADDDQELLQQENGYIQFKLYKGASYGNADASRASTSLLDSLSQAEKVKVVLDCNGITASYTLGLNRYSDENAEYGLRSDKLQLTEGQYRVVGFYLYNKVEEVIYAGEPAEGSGTFTIVSGGLEVKDLLVNVVARGQVKFSLRRTGGTTARAGETVTGYPFSSVNLVDIRVKNTDTKQITEFRNLKVTYKETFKNEDASSGDADFGYQMGVGEIDTLVTLEAGNYEVVYYYTKSKSGGVEKALEGNDSPEECTFSVVDSKPVDVSVPVTLRESAAYIKDYLALKDIWEATGGPDKWFYVGQSYIRGANWDFNKELDMWGDQPGVALNSDGRVVTLTLGDFGPVGEIPDAIGQLTELTSLSIGTHNDAVRPDNPLAKISGELTEEDFKIIRSDYMDNFVLNDVLSGFSKDLQWGMKEKGLKIKARTVEPKDVNHGVLTNQITGISPEIGKLTKLETLFIANSPITSLPSTLKDLEACSDMELYNCPKLTTFPTVLADMPELVQLNLAMNPQWSSQEIENGVRALATGASKDKIQMLYLGYNNLTTLPAEISNFKKMGKIDCIHNKLQGRVTPFGTDVNLVQVSFDYNEITEVPENFCGIADVETLSFTHNKITELPDMFDLTSVYVMNSVDFSYNEIASIPDNYGGVNCTTLGLSNNKLTAFPRGLFQKGNTIQQLNLSGNAIERFAKGILSTGNAWNITVLDLSNNRLRELPDDVDGHYLPFLYGMDLSGNRFNAFPFGPLNAATLTVFSIRNQRDDNGNRVLKEWPTNVYQHTGLRALFLGGNDIGKVPETETISYRINQLDISDNPNIIINVSDVCAYIRAGAYLLIYDRTQDIRGCDALDLE